MTSIHGGQPVLVAAFDTKSIQHWQKLLTETLHVLKPGVNACDMSTQRTARRSGKRNTASTTHGPALGCKRKTCFSMQAVSLKNNCYIHDFFIYWTCESNQSLNNLQDYFNTEQAKNLFPWVGYFSRDWIDKKKHS
jgi:hypothetical protein